VKTIDRKELKGEDRVLLTVVFVTHGDRIGVVKRLVKSIFPYRDVPWVDFICVDNGSEPSSAEFVRSNHPFVRVIENSENKGTSRAFNAGIRNADGEYVLIINDDSVIPEGMLEKLRAYLIGHPDCAGIALGLKRDKNTYQALRLRILNIGKRHPRRRRRATFIGTGNLLIKTALIREVGLYDENYFAGNEDMDLSQRLKQQGVKIHYFPEFFIYHLHVYRNRKTSWAEFVLARRLSDIYYAQKFFPLLSSIARMYAFRNFKKRVEKTLDKETLRKAKKIMYTKKESYYEVQKSIIKNGIDSVYAQIAGVE
jgi:GT2 family glycosyltransferase